MLDTYKLPGVEHDEWGVFEEIFNVNAFGGSFDLANRALEELRDDDPLSYAFRTEPKAPSWDLGGRQHQVHLVNWFAALQYRDDERSVGGSDADALSSFVTALQTGLNGYLANMRDGSTARDPKENIPRTGDMIISKSSDGIDVKVLVAWAGDDAENVPSAIQDSVSSSSLTFSTVVDGTGAENDYVFVFLTDRGIPYCLEDTRYVKLWEQKETGSDEDLHLFLEGDASTHNFVGCMVMTYDDDCCIGS